MKLATGSDSAAGLNVVSKQRRHFPSLLSDAHQLLAIGILMRLGFPVARSTDICGTYDLVIPAYENFPVNGEKTVLLRAATRTMRQSLRFTAGARGGKNRIYLTDVKVYKYTEEHNDLIIGVDAESLDLYLVPTRHIAKWGESRSQEKLQVYKNNWSTLLNWNDQFLKKLEAQA